MRREFCASSDGECRGHRLCTGLDPGSALGSPTGRLAAGRLHENHRGPFVGNVSTKGDTLLDRRLDVPGEWVTDDAEAERCTQGGIPPVVTFTTKPALAQEMLTAVVKPPGRR
jgi:hypothetical protein